MLKTTIQLITVAMGLSALAMATGCGKGEENQILNECVRVSQGSRQGCESGMRIAQKRAEERTQVIGGYAVTEITTAQMAVAQDECAKGASEDACREGVRQTVLKAVEDCAGMSASEFESKGSASCRKSIEEIRQSYDRDCLKAGQKC